MEVSPTRRSCATRGAIASRHGHSSRVRGSAAACVSVLQLSRGSTYTTFMELGTNKHNKDGLLGPISIMVMYMDPLGYLRETNLVILRVKTTAPGNFHLRVAQLDELQDLWQTAEQVFGSLHFQLEDGVRCSEW